MIECKANLSTRDLIHDFEHAVTPLMAVTGVLCVTGIIGNLVVLYVHLVKYKKCNFRIFVLYLCFLDLVSCILIPLQMHLQHEHFNVNHGKMCKALSFLNIATSIGNIYGLLLIAVDRYRKVCRPHGWQMTENSVLICLFISACIACIFASPVIELWGINTSQVQYKGCMVDVILCIKSSDYNDHNLPTLYVIGLTPNLLLLGVVLVIYGFVFQKLAKSVAATKARIAEPLAKPVQPPPSSIFTIREAAIQNTFEQESGDPTTTFANAREWFATDDEDSDDEDEPNTNDNTGTGAPRRSNTFVDRGQKHLKISNLRRVTLLTFSFTIVFFITALTYFSVGLRDSGLTAGFDVDISVTIMFLFLYRFYNINLTMHPILYGFFDPNFKKAFSKTSFELSDSFRRRFSVKQ